MNGKFYRFLLITAITMGMATTASAQRIDIGLQGTPSIPIDDNTSNVFELGFGGKLTGEFFLSDHIGVGVDLGYIAFSETINVGASMQQDVELNVIPLEATGTYHLDASEDFDVFGGAGVGVSIIDDGIDATDSETNLSFSPRIGASYAITDELRANLTGSYLVITNDNDNVDSSQLLNINLGLTYTILD